MKERIVQLLDNKVFVTYEEDEQRISFRDHNALEEAAEEISKLIPQWIPVSEKLPEDGEIVLTNTKALGLSINTYRARDKERYMLYVLGWIPGSDLLKLPKEAK